MKRHIMLGALALAHAAGPRGEKIEKGLTAFWIADYHSLTLHGAGAPINWAAFTDPSFGPVGQRVVPSGYPVSLVNGKIEPATGAVETMLMMSAAHENNHADSISGYGLVTGGNVYEAYLPTATGNPRQLPAGVRGKLPARFHLQ